MKNRIYRHCQLAFLATMASVLLTGTNPIQADENEFASTTIDLGVVVSDVQKSVEFYTKAVGFKELQGFSVPGDFAAEAGLTDSKPLEIRVLVLGEGESATRLKLMQLPGVQSKKSDNEFIHSQFGYSYITIKITDTTKAMERLTKANVKPIANSPAALPAPLPQGVYLTVVRDPDGNLVELVGPKK